MGEATHAETAPGVTVVMAACNAAGFIGEAIASVLSQTYGDFELLVIDDASHDGTADVVRACEDVRVRLVSLPHNCGAAAARNRGLREARADLVAILDADDLAYPQRLARQVAYMHADPACGLLGTSYDEIDAAGNRRATVRQLTEPGLLRWRLLTANAYGHCTVMMRREVALAAGGYDERLRNAEDYALWVLLARATGVAGIDAVLGAYRSTPGSLTATKPDLDVPAALRVAQGALSTAAGRAIGLDAVRCLQGRPPRDGGARSACVEGAAALAAALERQVDDAGGGTSRDALLTDWRVLTARLCGISAASWPQLVAIGTSLSLRVAGARGLGSGHLVWIARAAGYGARAFVRRVRSSVRP
jgi:hypothetical protein